MLFVHPVSVKRLVRPGTVDITVSVTVAIGVRVDLSKEVFGPVTTFVTGGMARVKVSVIEVVMKVPCSDTLSV